MDDNDLVEIPFPTASYVMWITFIIIMPILLNNLLVSEKYVDKSHFFTFSYSNRQPCTHPYASSGTDLQCKALESHHNYGLIINALYCTMIWEHDISIQIGLAVGDINDTLEKAEGKKVALEVSWCTWNPF